MSRCELARWLAGLTILVCASNADADSCPKLISQWAYGPAFGTARVDHYGYFGSGRTLMVADLSNPGEPTIAHELVLPQVIFSIDIDGDLAFVAAGSSLRVLDLSNPARPFEIGSVETGATDVAVANGYAYIAFVGGWFSYLTVVDVRNPGAPRLVDTRMYPAASVATSSGHLFVAGDGVRVLDLTDPESPTEVQVIETPRYPFALTITETLMYVVDSEFGLRIFEISEPEAPVELGGIPCGPGVIAVSGSRVFLSGADSILREIDASDPAYPLETGSIDIPAPGLHYYYPVVSSLAVSDGVAIAADTGSGLHVIDVSTPRSPSHVALLEMPGSPWRMSPAGGYALMLEHVLDATRLRVLDLARPRTPTTVATLEISEWCDALDIAGGHAFIGCYDRLRVVDISDPERPLEIGDVETPGSACEVTIDGRYAFCGGCYFGSLAVVDISNPQVPRLLGSIETREARDLAVAGDTVLVTRGYAGIESVDVSIPTAPVETTHIVSRGFADGIAVVGDYAYVAEGEAGLQIIRLADAGRLERVGGVATPAPARSVAVARDIAFVGGDWAGVLAFDVSEPTAPVECGRRGRMFSSTDATLSGDAVGLSGYEGFELYDTSGCFDAAHRRQPPGRPSAQ